MVIIVIHSIQKWLPFEKILENGIIKLKNNSYIMILKIKPINYNLKSNLEKESILNSYKLFLKSFNFCIMFFIYYTSAFLRSCRTEICSFTFCISFSLSPPISR